MQKQNEITKETQLLDENGNVLNPGYAKSMLYVYDRKMIKASKLKIKEWDYYLIYNDDFGVALTIDDNGYMGLMSASILDFKNKTERTVSTMNFMPLGKTNLPATSKVGDTSYTSKRVDFNFINHGNKRVLDVSFKKFDEEKDFSCHFELTNEPKESMVIATPFFKPKRFYLNQKIIGFTVSGYAKLGETEYDFTKNSFALLDWGRGVWTYKNTWYWGAGMGKVDGKMFGFNIGYGFGNTENATENMLFYEGKAHKLDGVTFQIPVDEKGKNDFLKPWKFVSTDNRFEMDFEPILDRKSCTDLLILKSDQHQVFGKFTGTAILDDGTKIKIKDFLGFAEKVFNKW